MFHDFWFWMTVVLSVLIVAFAGFVVYAVRSVARPEAVPTTVHGHIDVCITGKKVKLRFPTSVPSVTLSSTSARTLAAGIVQVADEIERNEALLPDTRPTAWDRLRGEGR